MTLIYRQERWAGIIDEMKPLLTIQWRELALDQELIALDPDYEKYAALDATGLLKITTARAGERLVGWYWMIVAPHPHYRTTLFGFTDLYFLLPEFRRGFAGVGLFRAMEESMRALGVKELISISKTHRPVTSIFRRLGWRDTGTTYTKVLT